MKIDDVNLLSQNVNDVRKEYAFRITFETFTAVTMKSTILWGMLAWSLVEVTNYGQISQPHILLYRILLSAGKGIGLLKVNVEKVKYM
jgi:hypothetical protein